MLKKLKNLLTNNIGLKFLFRFICDDLMAGSGQY